MVFLDTAGDDELSVFCGSVDELSLLPMLDAVECSSDVDDKISSVVLLLKSRMSIVDVGTSVGTDCVIVDV